VPGSERVSLAACPDYAVEGVETALRRLLAPLGGMGAFVAPGQKVVLKPNLLRAAAPETAITTHPVLVAAVSRIVHEAGGEPFILDSPGGPASAPYVMAVYRATGMVEAAEAGGATLITRIHSTQVPVRAGLILQHVDLVREALEADVLISLPKLKTHGLTGMSVAVKNLFGLVPGTTKVIYHRRLGNPPAMARGILDIAMTAGAALHIVDAVIGMEGNGPSAGNPRSIGALVAGSDPLAVDIVSAALVGHRPMEMLPIRLAVEAGLTTGRVADLELLGDSLEQLAVTRFRLPDAYRADSARRRSFLARWTRDRTRHEQPPVTLSASTRCTGCGLCARHCPASAIVIVDGRATMDMDRCIRCYCCHELCPSLAVDVHTAQRRRVLGRF